MKKVIKYFFIILAVLIALPAILYGADDPIAEKQIYGLASPKERSQFRQEIFAKKAQEQIVMFYKKNGYYPKSLQDLPVYNNPEFVTLLQKEDALKYDSYGAEKKSKYVFSWRGNGRSWSSFRCTNDDSVLYQIHHYMEIRIFKMTGGTVCIVSYLPIK